VVRYGLLAYFANLYGRKIMSVFSQYGWPILYALIAFAVVSALTGYVVSRLENGKAKAKAA
jgi:uncharacterized membrane protein YkvI